MPDDCGLNPPIETLPQIAQERAMGSSGNGSGGGIGPGRPERGGMIAHASGRPAGRPTPSMEDQPRGHPPDARPFTRHPAAPLRDIVRTATLGSYGVTGFAGGPVGRIIERLGLGQPGLAVRLDDGIEIELDLTVALGVPVAEVARQVDSASVTPSGGRSVARSTRIVIHIDGLHVPAGGGPPVDTAESPPDGIRPRDLADSGTDVA